MYYDFYKKWNSRSIINIAMMISEVITLHALYFTQPKTISVKLIVLDIADTNINSNLKSDLSNSPDT